MCIEASHPPGDAPCPHCGHLLWFAPSGKAPGYFVTKIQIRLARYNSVDLIAKRLGISAKVARDYCRAAGIKVTTRSTKLPPEQVKLLVHYVRDHPTLPVHKAGIMESLFGILRHVRKGLTKRLHEYLRK